MTAVTAVAVSETSPYLVKQRGGFPAQRAASRPGPRSLVPVRWPAGPCCALAPQGRPGARQAGRRLGRAVRGRVAAALHAERSPVEGFGVLDEVFRFRAPPGLPAFPMPCALLHRRVSPLPPRTDQCGLGGQPLRTRGAAAGRRTPPPGSLDPTSATEGVGGEAHSQAACLHPVARTSGPGRPSLPAPQRPVVCDELADPRGGGREEEPQEGGARGYVTAPGPDSFRPWRGARGAGLKFSSEAPTRRWGAEPPTSWARPYK